MLLMMIGVSLTTVLIINQLGPFMDYAKSAIENPNLSLNEVLGKVRDFIIITSLILLLNGLFKGAELYTNARFNQTFLRRLRSDIFDHLQRLSLDFFEGEQTGRLMSYTTNDVTKLREFLHLQFPKMVASGISLVIYLGYMIIISWKLTLLSFLVFPILLVLMQIGAKAVRKISILVQEKLADISRVLQEDIANILVKKSFTAEAREKRRFEAENRETYKAEMKRATVQAVLIPPMHFLSAIGVGVFLYLGAYVIRSGHHLAVSDLLKMVVTLWLLSDESVKLGRGYFNLQ